MINMRTCFCALLTLLFFSFASCKPKEEKEKPVTVEPDAFTPVTVTAVNGAQLTEYIELNAVSAFLQKSFVKAPANGYLQSVRAFIGKPVENGQLLFTMKTKESQSIGNTISVLDSTFKFSGLINIKVNGHGYVTQLNHQSGDYVQDGEQLAAISDRNSFVFLLDLPYELRKDILGKKNVELVLPGGEKLNGFISSSMPTVDATSQTQGIVIKVNSSHDIPENVIAKVRILKTEKSNTQSLPKGAVLANETQTDFWVMKMTDSVTAVKIPIKKGIETGDRVEIISPVFSPGDKILVSGNYGLPDTAKVKIVQ